ncbi:hypothetical protein D3C81_987660 [compost metagenome]
MRQHLYLPAVSFPLFRVSVRTMLYLLYSLTQQWITYSKNSYANDYLSEFILIILNEPITLGFILKATGNILWFQKYLDFLTINIPSNSLFFNSIFYLSNLIPKCSFFTIFQLDTNCIKFITDTIRSDKIFICLRFVA